MKKVMIISPIPSHPQDQGNRRRIFDICQTLKASGFSVHFIWYAHESGGIISNEDYAAMASAWDQLFVVPINPRRQNYKQITESSNIDALWYNGIADMISWCSINHDYDFAIATYAMYSKALLAFKGMKTVTILDTQDVLTDRHALLKDQGMERQFYSTSAKEERKAINRADIVLAIQEVEAEHFKELGHKRVLTIGNQEAEKVIESSTLNSMTAGFIGSNTNINVESCKRLIEFIEKYQDRLPNNFQLLIAGSMCRGINFAVPSCVKLLGPLDNLNYFYSRLNIVLIPTEFGSGLKIKAIEALSFGLPILATKHSFVGINSECSNHNLQDVEELVLQMTDIITNKEKLAALRLTSQNVFKNYHALVQTQYGQLFNMIDTVRDQKRNLALAYDSGEIIKDFSQVYIYGGGAGCQFLLSNMSSLDKKKVKGIIDKYKTGVGYNNTPIIRPDTISQEVRRECLVILSLTSTEHIKVNKIMKNMGFHNVVNASSFIVKGLRGFS